MSTIQNAKRLLLTALLFFTAFTPASAFQRETAVVRAVRNVAPAVVNIGTEYEVYARSNPFSGYSGNPLFDSFFRDFFGSDPERRKEQVNLGSGIIIDGTHGYVLTNAHVIERANTLTVTMKDERVFQAKIMGADPDTDLAVLRLESGKPLPSLGMGHSSDLMIGETVIAIGNPFGFSHTVTTGVVSALNRSVRTKNAVYHDFIQTDASINPGNSGGPLLNINGELVGVNTAIYAGARGIGFAIPIDKARRIVEDLIAHGEVIPAWIGLIVQNIDPRTARYLDLPEQTGVMARSVEKDSPAARAGVEPGDVILSISGKKLYSVAEYRLLLKEIPAGEEIPLSFQRNNRVRTLRLKTESFPLSRASDLAWHLLGVRVGAVSKHRTKVNGVFIAELDDQSYLARIGARIGDIIRQIDDQPIYSVEEFHRSVVRFRNRRSLVMLIRRGVHDYYVTVRL